MAEVLKQNRVITNDQQKKGADLIQMYQNKIRLLEAEKYWLIENQHLQNIIRQKELEIQSLKSKQDIFKGQKVQSQADPDLLDQFREKEKNHISQIRLLEQEVKSKIQMIVRVEQSRKQAQILNLEYKKQMEGLKQKIAQYCERLEANLKEKEQLEWRLNARNRQFEQLQQMTQEEEYVSKVKCVQQTKRTTGIRRVNTNQYQLQQQKLNSKCQLIELLKAKIDTLEKSNSKLSSKYDRLQKHLLNH